MSDGRIEGADSALKRWWRRFQRSLSFPPGAFKDEQFEDLVATLVTGATVEGMLWVGLQFCRYPAKEDTRKTISLGRLIQEGAQRSLISSDLETLLRAFADIRTDFAHDIDYRLTEDAIGALASLLPETAKGAIATALGKVVDPSHGLVMRLVYDRIAAITFEAVDAAYERWSGPGESGPDF